MGKFIIYTDGSSKGNPGPGGWGAIIEERDSSNEVRIKEIGGRAEQTTNNKMELTAAIEALKYIDSQTSDVGQVEIFTDSEYVLKGITMWIWGWMKNGWRTKDKKEVLNKDLWKQLLEVSQNKKIEWKKVKGHAGDKYNERCDFIATTFADGKNPFK